MDLERTGVNCSKNNIEARRFAASLDLRYDINVYTDGACSGNPGPGGWGVYITGMKDGQKVELEYGGGSANTTNNRMELIAAIEGINIFNSAQKIKLYTDSKYVLEGITKWVKGWKKYGWRRNKGMNELLNSDLWKRLDEVNNGTCVEWIWVKGHASTEGNNKADRIAVSFTPSFASISKPTPTRQPNVPAQPIKFDFAGKEMTLAEILQNIIHHKDEKESIEKLKRYDQKYSLALLLKNLDQKI